MLGARRARRAAHAGAVVAALAVVAGCASTVPVSAGPSSTDPHCSNVLVTLPDQVGGLTRREVTSQATAAWAGADQAQAVRLRCGITPPGPTIDPCTVVGGVDWVVDEHSGQIRYRTFGRVPAVEIDVPPTHQDGLDTLLSAISGALAPLPATATCQ